MNDTFHPNGISYINNTISWNIPVCSGLGLYCSSLYNRRVMVAYFSTIGNFIIIPFVLYLTLIKMKDGFSKHFTMNLIVVCIATASAALVIDAINIGALYVPLRESKLPLIEIRRWARFFVKLGSIWFHGLSLYAIIICYLPYVKPVFYSKKFVHRSQKLYYATLHTLILIWSGFVTFLLKEFISLIPYFFTHIILFVALFIVAFIGAINIRRYKPLGVTDVRIARMQQKRLFSFILYSCSIEFITLPMFVNACAYSACIFAGCERDFINSDFKTVLNLLIYYLYEIRTIVIIIATILSLEPYRRATLSLFCGKKCVTEVDII